MRNRAVGISIIALTVITPALLLAWSYALQHGWKGLWARKKEFIKSSNSEIKQVIDPGEKTIAGNS